MYHYIYYNCIGTSYIFLLWLFQQSSLINQFLASKCSLPGKKCIYSLKSNRCWNNDWERHASPVIFLSLPLDKVTSQFLWFFVSKVIKLKFQISYHKFILIYWSIEQISNNCLKLDFHQKSTSLSVGWMIVFLRSTWLQKMFFRRWENAILEFTFGV